MDTFDKWWQLSVDQGEIFKRSINALRPVMEEMNRQQLLQGKRAKGSALPTPYSNPYAKKRQRAGLQTAVKDLRFSGAFHEGIYAIGFETFVEMGSKNSKTDILEFIYGEQIFGLSEENLNKLKVLLMQEIRTNLKSVICGI